MQGRPRPHTCITVEVYPDIDRSSYLGGEGQEAGQSPLNTRFFDVQPATRRHAQCLIKLPEARPCSSPGRKWNLVTRTVAESGGV